MVGGSIITGGLRRAVKGLLQPIFPRRRLTHRTPQRSLQKVWAESLLSWYRCPQYFPPGKSAFSSVCMWLKMRASLASCRLQETICEHHPGRRKSRYRRKAPGFPLVNQCTKGARLRPRAAPLRASVSLSMKEAWKLVSKLASNQHNPGPRPAVAGEALPTEMVGTKSVFSA
ncbi:hypothetical protein NN561_017264 [Cricetulus griseus]